jgi:large subunit ribosomal protein L25
MADELRIKAETRTEFGKGAARRIRRDHKVPAVLYGHGTEPVHVTLPGHELMLALKNPNALLTIELADGEQLALPKAIQRHVIKGELEHVDLILVRRGEKVTVEVRVRLVGEPEPGGMVNHELTELSVEAEATNIPSEVEVTVEGLAIGERVSAGDVSLPAGSTLVTDPDHTVVSILAPQTVEEPEAEAAEGEEAAAGGEEAAAESEDES